MIIPLWLFFTFSLPDKNAGLLKIEGFRIALIGSNKHPENLKTGLSRRLPSCLHSFKMLSLMYAPNELQDLASLIRLILTQYKLITIHSSFTASAKK